MKVSTDEPKELITKLVVAYPGVEVQLLFSILDDDRKIGYDMLLQDRVLVERKEVHDLYSSIVDGRFEMNITGHAASHAGPRILIVEGDLDSFLFTKKGGWVRSCLVDAIGLGWQIVRTKDMNDTVRWLVSLEKNLKKEYETRITDVKIKSRIPQVDAIRACPGVGKKRALTILNKAKSLKNVVNLTADEMAALPGIGKKTGEVLANFFNEPIA